MRILHQQQNKIADLEKQLAEKDKEIELTNQKITILERALLNACTELQESDNGYVNLAGSILKPENAMEIEYEIALSDLGLIVPENLPDVYCGCNYDFEGQLKDQRHQICEEIKEKVQCRLWEVDDGFYMMGNYSLPEEYRKLIFNILDQIEKGE